MKRTRPLMLVAMVMLISACTATTGQVRKSHLEGISADDGDWFLLGAHVQGMAGPYGEKDFETVETHIAAIEEILEHHEILDEAKAIYEQMRDAFSPEGGVSPLNAILSFNDMMTQHLIPEDRGVGFYVLGSVAGGIESIIAVESREGLEELQPQLLVIRDEVLPKFSDIPAGLSALTDALIARTEETYSFSDILEFLEELYAEIPHR